MKSVMLSIHPKWCKLIASGKKTIEVRKTRPNCELPIRCYIYETRAGFGCGKVIGDFVCKDIYYLTSPNNIRLYNKAIIQLSRTCLSEEDILEYCNADDNKLYFWEIYNLIIYDKPIELSEFKKYNRTCYYDHLDLATPKCKDCKECNLTRPPQSWCYLM